MRRRILSAAVTLTLAITLGFIAASSAQAAPFTSWCHGAGVICFGEHNNGEGIRWGPRTFPYGQCVTAPSNFRRKMSSLWNKYGIDNTPPLGITAYSGLACDRSALYTWGPEAFVQYVGFLNNDKMESVCLGPRQRNYCP